MAVSFWTWWRGEWRGIYLAKPGAEVTLHHTERHDEGWSSCTEVYTLTDDGRVLCSVYTDGRDCDGRFATEAHYQARLDELDAIPADTGTLNPRPALPRWAELSRGQRDYAAEAAGY